MNTEQREEIERDISLLELVTFTDDEACESARKVLQFARQQLNLRVDGEKLYDQLHISGLVVEMKSKRYFRELEAIVLKCLTTTPEEKE